MRRRILFLVTGVFAFLAVMGGAQSSATLRAKLESPFERERKLAIRRLSEQLRAGLLSPDGVMTWTRSSKPRLRAGALAVMAANLENKAVRKLIPRVIATESDPGVLRSQVGEMARRCLRTQGVNLGEFIPTGISESRLRSLRRALREVVRGEISQLVKMQRPWSQSRAQIAFRRLEPHAAPELIDAIYDNALPLKERSLAAVVLGRLDAPSFWSHGEDAKSDRWARALDGEESEFPEELKSALLFAYSIRGEDGDRRAARLEQFALKEAFGGGLIESALFALYTLPGELSPRKKSALGNCFLEFATAGYSDREHFSAAQILGRFPDPALIRRAAQFLLENDLSFATHFLFANVMDSLDKLPTEEAKSLRNKLVARVRKDKATPPQIKYAAEWYAKKAGLDSASKKGLDALIAEVRKEALATMRGRAAIADDSDHYSLRAAAALFAIHPAPANIAVLRLMLAQQSEAVRFMASYAIGEAGHRALIAPLVALSGPDAGDYERVGAGTALAKLGDERGKWALVQSLERANRVVAPHALAALRTTTKMQIAEDLPTGPKAWILRAAQWKKRLTPATTPAR